MGEKATTPKFRVSFPNVFKASAFDENSEAKFDVVALFEDGTDLSGLKDACEAAAIEKWGKKVPKNCKTPFHDGNDKEYDGYADATWVRFSSKRRPGVVDQNVQPIIDPSEFYGGCYAIATVNAYAYGGPGTKFQAGVALGLQNIQKVAEGEPFGEAVSNAEEDFAPVSGGTGTDKAEAKESTGGLFD